MAWGHFFPTFSDSLFRSKPPGISQIQNLPVRPEGHLGALLPVLVLVPGGRHRGSSR